MGIMVTRVELEKLGRRIVDRFHPEKVILFGSQAKKTATADSDVDILVVMDHEGSALRQAGLVYQVILDRAFPVDVLVRTPRELASRLAEGDPFTREIMATGETLYDATHQ